METPSRGATATDCLHHSADEWKTKKKNKSSGHDSSVFTCVFTRIIFIACDERVTFQTTQLRSHLHNGARSRCARIVHADSDWHVSAETTVQLLYFHVVIIILRASHQFRFVLLLSSYIHRRRRRVRSCVRVPIYASPPGRLGYRSCMRRNGRNYILQPTAPC